MTTKVAGHNTKPLEYYCYCGRQMNVKEKSPHSTLYDCPHCIRRLLVINGKAYRYKIDRIRKDAP